MRVEPGGVVVQNPLKMMNGVFITVPTRLHLSGDRTDKLEDSLWGIELATGLTPPVSLARGRVEAQDAASAGLRGRGGGAGAEERGEVRAQLRGVQTPRAAAGEEPDVDCETGKSIITCRRSTTWPGARDAGRRWPSCWSRTGWRSPGPWRWPPGP